MTILQRACTPSFNINNFISKIEIKDKDDCWSWLGWHANGYGKFDLVTNGRRHHQYAHILLWEILNGPVPAGLEIDHECQHKWCINPYHHRLLTHMENSLHWKLPTHCKYNHEYLVVGYYTRNRRGASERRCKECVRQRKA